MKEYTAPIIEPNIDEITSNTISKNCSRRSNERICHRLKTTVPKTQRINNQKKYIKQKSIFEFNPSFCEDLKEAKDSFINRQNHKDQPKSLYPITFNKGSTNGCAKLRLSRHQSMISYSQEKDKKHGLTLTKKPVWNSYYVHNFAVKLIKEKGTYKNDSVLLSSLLCDAKKLPQTNIGQNTSFMIKKNWNTYCNPSISNINTRILSHKKQLSTIILNYKEESNKLLKKAYGERSWHLE